MKISQLILMILFISLILALSGCQSKENSPSQVESAESLSTDSGVLVERVNVNAIDSLDTIDQLLVQLTLSEKVGQLIQGERSKVQLYELSNFNLGSILSGGGSVPPDNTPKGWVELYNRLQRASRNSSSGIPVVYGIDAVHGHNNVIGATIFPHNIGLGATGNVALVQEIGAMTAEEILATGLNWNFAPAVSITRDLRWGRTYEGFSEDGNTVAQMGAAYVKGLQSKGVMATTKHFIGDGYVQFGTGEGNYLLDRGDVTIETQQMLDVYLPAYKMAIAAGTKSIMVSYNSVQGQKMHGHKELIQGVLRDELGYDGLVLSDWEAITELPGTLEEQVAQAVGAGIDMLMQPHNYKEVHSAIMSGVEKGLIPMTRIDEAVRRVLIFKFEAGLFTEDFERIAGEIGTERARSLAQEAVAQSLVLLKNENKLLPLQKDIKVYLTGPASDDLGVQCGGWTLSWQGEMGSERIQGTTVRGALEKVLHANGGEIVNTPEEADVIVLAIGERPYAEGYGDVDDLSLTGPMTLEGNLEALQLASTVDKPVLTIMIAGRPRLVDEYLADWDAFVMAFLPGTEGDGIAEVLFGTRPFTGTLPITWPRTNDQAAHTIYMENYTPINYQFPFGFGLK